MQGKREWTWWGEVSGAIGDLGVTLPLAFALSHASGMPLTRLLGLWGIVYVACGFYFRVPMSVQPLKAMAVVAIGLGIQANVLSTAAVGYGVLFLVLAFTGTTSKLHRLFSPALVRGIQLAIGLILMKKAATLVWTKGWFLGDGEPLAWVGVVAAVAIVAVLQLSSKVGGRSLLLPTILLGIVAGYLVAGPRVATAEPSALIAFQMPDWKTWPQLFVLLLLPQLPLTLGNAVIAASDTCEQYFPKRAERTSVNRLAASIGWSNIGLGFLGGFPICHGAGGIAAHAKFGARTGRAPILLGTAFVALSLIPGASGVLLRTPVPILGALLAVVSWEMMMMVRSLERRDQLAVAITVAVISFSFRNLAIGLVAGWILERLLKGRTHAAHHGNLHEPKEGHRQDLGSTS